MWPRSFLSSMALGAEATRMMLDAQSVIAMRMAGMMGLRDLPADETHRMISEKQAALIKATLATQKALLSGSRPDQVMRAGMKPFRKAAGKNVRRLSDDGRTAKAAE